LRKDIIQKLSERANGMFLWVNLMFDQIVRMAFGLLDLLLTYLEYDMSRPSDVVEALETAPRSLSKMIHHAFQRLAADLRGFRKEDFNEILSWVTSAQRPLHLDELDSILRLRPPLGEGVPDLEKRLRDQFASFFTLKRKDGLTTEALLERAAHVAENWSSAHSDADTAISGGSSDWESDGSDDSDATDGESSSSSDLPESKPDPYNSPSSSTTITFSHASIRDYLIRESNPLKKEFHDDLGIGVNTNETEKHITITCLKVLTAELKLPYREDSESSDDSDSDDSGSDSLEDANSDDSGADSKDGKSDDGSTQSDEYVWDLEDYAADHFMDHLKRTDKATLTTDEQTSITKSLVQLFTDADSIDNWIDGTTDLEDFANEWIGTGKYGEWVRGWFISQISGNAAYTNEDKDMMSKLSVSDDVLLKPFAAECVKRWLTPQKDEYSSGYVAFLDLYVPKVDTKSVHITIVSPNPTLGSDEDSEDISESRLCQLADFGGLEKTSYWHSNLGEAMRIEEHYDTAIRLLKTAIELDGSNWIAMGRLSSSYEDCELWELAIEWYVPPFHAVV
jgi:hypothetical protein